MRQLLVLLLISSPAWALGSSAPTSASALTHCTLAGDLSGDPDYYKINLQDSWVGSALMNCVSNSGQQVARAINLRFVSDNSQPHGIPSSSTIHVSMDLYSTIAPNVLLFRSVIAAQLNDGLLSWRLTSFSTTATFDVSGYSPSYADSLESGTVGIEQ